MSRSHFMVDFSIARQDKFRCVWTMDNKPVRIDVLTLSISRHVKIEGMIKGVLSIITWRPLLRLSKLSCYYFLM